jgi:hypothetical protein
MALFGAPVAHEDDPERAVRAALAIRDWAREGGDVQVRIAVNTGEVVVNLDARPESGDGMAAGDVVNTTARLQAAAPENGVLVGETTYRATRQAIDFRGAEAVEAKGKAAPVIVWEALAPRSRITREAVSTATPLVGRERELAVLRELLVRVREESSPQLVTLVGVPGIGKSRLVQELMQIFEHGGVLSGSSPTAMRSGSRASSACSRVRVRSKRSERATGGIRRSRRRDGSSRRWPRSDRSSSCSRTSIGRTRRCSTSWTTSSSGLPPCPS